MNRYQALCDDFYINLNLNTEMELPSSRETILQFFERLQKAYPTMRNFFCRDRGDFVLEEDREQGSYRWCTVEARRVCSGYVNPDTVAAALDQHRLVLDIVPYMLTVSPLDCEALDLLFGFDYTYRGNHNQVVAEALGVSPALERLLEIPEATVTGYEPTLTIALDEEFRLQCRVSVETRTNFFQVHGGEYPEEQLSVYVTARQYGSLAPGKSFVETFNRLAEVCEHVVDNYVVDYVLRPLARTIALK